MNYLFYALLSTTIISLFSLLGIFTLSLKQSFLKKLIPFLVALSAGTLLGGVFLHLLPESVEHLAPDLVFPLVLAAFILFFIIEKVLHWRHCHQENCKTHSFAYMNLLGDGLHNFIDGMLIASAFSVNFKLGIVTSLSISLHELPQELGDFGVLIHAGLTKRRALFFNLLSALTAVLGAILAFFLASNSAHLAELMLPAAAGGFLYIAAADLLPEMRQEKSLKKMSLSVLAFFLGIILMFLARFFKT